MTVGDLALGTERVTENVLVPGTYTLVASAKGFLPHRQTVAVHASEITHVKVMLQKQ